MRSMPLEEAAAGSTKNVGHLKGGPGHLFTRLLECFISPEVDTASTLTDSQRLAGAGATDARNATLRAID